MNRLWLKMSLKDAIATPIVFVNSKNNVIFEPEFDKVKKNKLDHWAHFGGFEVWFPWCERVFAVSPSRSSRVSKLSDTKWKTGSISSTWLTVWRRRTDASKPSPTNGRRASRLDTDRRLRAGITSDEPRRTFSLKAEKRAETVQLEPIMDTQARLGGICVKAESSQEQRIPPSKRPRERGGGKSKYGGGEAELDTQLPNQTKHS